jgi:hypothetical protein
MGSRVGTLDTPLKANPPTCFHVTSYYLCIERLVEFIGHITESCLSSYHNYSLAKSPGSRNPVCALHYL